MIENSRPAPYPADNEMMGDIHEGEAPRPATEPHGSEGTSNSGETATDPATGTPNDVGSSGEERSRERQDPEQMTDPAAAQEEAARQREEEGGYQ